MVAFVRPCRSTNRPSAVRRRTGAAAVELAVCLPILASLIFGSIEASNSIFLQQALTIASYEAGSVASAIGGDSDTATNQANAVLSAFGIKSATVTITPAVTSDTPIGTIIVVTCSAPLSANTSTTWCLGKFTQTTSFTSSRL